MGADTDAKATEKALDELIFLGMTALFTILRYTTVRPKRDTFSGL